MTDFEFLKFLFSAGVVMSLIKIIYNKLNTDIKKINKEIEFIESKINKLEIYVIKNCVERKDFKESVKNLSLKLDKIFSQTKK